MPLPKLKPSVLRLVDDIKAKSAHPPHTRPAHDPPPRKTPRRLAGVSATLRRAVSWSMSRVDGDVLNWLVDAPHWLTAEQADAVIREIWFRDLRWPAALGP